MIKAVIFDMDGLLIDSEPFWRQSEIQIFGNLGIHLTEDDCRGTTGMRIDEVMVYWNERFPGKIFDLAKTEDDIIQAVASLIASQGAALPGVIEVIEFFMGQNIPMAIASASSYHLINEVVKKLHIKSYFKIIQSAENLEYGKPHPQVFIECAKRLNVSEHQCLVFEDSVFGVIAAKAARMQVVAVPDEHNYNKIGYCIADRKIASMKLFNASMYNELCN